MANVVSDAWWQKHRPAKWSGTGIGQCLRTFEENDNDVTRSGERLAANTRLSDATAASASAAKQAAQDALDKLEKWIGKGDMSDDEQGDMALLSDQLRLVLSQYKYV